MQAQLAVYLTVLADLTPAELAVAVSEALKGEHFPVAGELLRYARPPRSAAKREMEARYRLDQEILAGRITDERRLLTEPADAAERREQRATEYRANIRRTLAQMSQAADGRRRADLSRAIGRRRKVDNGDE